MDLLRTGVFVFFVLPAPGSCLAFSTFSHPVICYFLDAFLLVYCIVATALFFKEKFSDLPSVAKPELERPTDPDPYQVLEPSKRKRKAGKKKKPGPNQNRDADP
uniref:T-cell surface glycoprotein CD3 zeta chain n=1 Tax=Amphiprion ocellaris TaxID=80972 RepID=A0AAQ5YAP3_AMPOC